MAEKEFLEDTVLNVMELFDIVRNVRREHVKIMLIEGIEMYKKRLSKSCFSESPHPQVKAFVAYALEALTLINGYLVDRKESGEHFGEVFDRMRAICRDFK
ncbi:MAG: hypothetical protein IJM54_03920 [Thermoguttaceae bacterium]|nr:hypothetical protein [Thermoguttaceae bacterium]